MARSSSVTTPAKRYTVNAVMPVGNGETTVVWGLELTGQEISNTLASGAYQAVVCTTCNDDAARCPDLVQFCPTDMVASAYDDPDAADDAPAPALTAAPSTVHGHQRHLCPMCGNVMWSSGWSFDDTVSCGACGNREKRRLECDYDACQGTRCAARVAA